MGVVTCELCPKSCRMSPGEAGDCRARVNLDGRLCAVTYGFPCAMHVDPVEKKPLYHFLPGTRTFSLAAAGCNLHCLNCQNWEISQGDPERVPAYHVLPSALPGMAEKYRCRSLSYTYTDPVAFYEYTLDSCRAARAAGLRNVMVSAGYINKRPLRELCGYLDAANIDLKSMSDRFYREVCFGTLKPVQEALVEIRERGVMLEITNLVIPTLNDSDDDLRKLSAWIKSALGAETPLHFSRFHPRYRMRELPPTPEETLKRAREIGLSEGLKYVYAGNVTMPEWSATRCPGCGGELIARSGLAVLSMRLKNGTCPDCGTMIAGVWE